MYSKLKMLPLWYTGVILYSSQSSQVNGDYVALNLVDGIPQLRYDLGSGSANIVSVCPPVNNIL